MREPVPGRLTIQTQHHAEAREAAKDAAARELTREIVKLAFSLTPRRKPSLLRRFIRSVTF